MQNCILKIAIEYCELCKAEELWIVYKKGKLVSQPISEYKPNRGKILKCLNGIAQQ